MKLVVLDGFTMNPGDLSWQALAALGDVTIYDRTPNALILERARDAEIIMTNKTPLTRETLAVLPKLRQIVVLATGYNVIDCEAARERGIPVCNAPAYSTRSVQQMTIALLLELTQQCGLHDQAVKAGVWSNCQDITFQLKPLIELDGLIMGIIGYGAIGQAVAEAAQAFGMQILVATRTPKPQVHPKVCFVTLDELFAQADVVSLHCPLTPQTANIICAENLAKMKPTAFLLNTSRGGLVHEQDLADALNNDRIAGAGVDVLSIEPPTPDNPLLHAKNIVITPHCAWATRRARQRLLDITIANIQAFQSGHAINVVNGVN